MPDTTAFEELPEIQMSSSAPLGGKGLGGAEARLNRQNSRGAAAERKRKANQLVKILNAFIGLQ